MADFARGFRLTTADGTQLDGAQFPNGFVATCIPDKGIDSIAISLDALLEHADGPSIEWDPNSSETAARLLDCGLCYEENGQEIHPHPECTHSSPAATAEQETDDEDDDQPTDSDSDVLALISEIASRLTDATDEGEYHAAGLIGDLANGRKTIAEAKSELADITFRHV